MPFDDPAAVPVFDGHNDVLLRLHLGAAPDPVGRFLTGDPDGHIDLPRARRGAFAGGLFAIFAPSESSADFAAYMTGDGYDVPLPPLLDPDRALRATMAMAALMHRIVRRSDGAVRLCLTAADVEAAIAAGALAAVLHVEGADAIDPDLAALEVLHAAGLRSLGPVWSRPTIFGHGVPFRFPSGPDTGPGLTDHGRRLVAACHDLGILVDLSHLNEQGFWDVAAIGGAPLVATHSNVHALSASTRNLTDRQLDAIRDSDGMVGVNLATAFLRPDGMMRGDTGIDWVVRHFEALIERLGETRVGLGSDFDGALVPDAVGDVAGTPAIIAALRERGYDEALIARLAHGNWIDCLRRTIG